MIWTAIDQERRAQARLSKDANRHAQILIAENHLWNLRKQSETFLACFVNAKIERV